MKKVVYVILIVSIVSVPIAFAIHSIINSIDMFQLLIECCLIELSVFVSIWQIGLNMSEKTMICKALANIKRKLYFH
jgi:hypothetical protein